MKTERLDLTLVAAFAVGLAVLTRQMLVLQAGSCPTLPSSDRRAP